MPPCTCESPTSTHPPQVEEQAHPQLAGQPIAVIQYNPFGDLATIPTTADRTMNDSNGSIIALNYGAARKAGVKRNMRGHEARKLCPSLQLVQVPVSNGKADLTNYRHHGQRVLSVLARPYMGVGARILLHVMSSVCMLQCPGLKCVLVCVS